MAASEFYQRLLAKGQIPLDADVPPDLCVALAAVIDRYAECYISPDACPEWVALVVEGLRHAGWTVNPPTAWRYTNTGWTLKQTERGVESETREHGETTANHCEHVEGDSLAGVASGRSGL